METVNTRRAALVSLGALGILLLASLWFWKERMLLCDAPHIAFRIINQQTLQIQQHRYGSFITQAVPLLASKLHLPLKTVLILYSLSFTLFPFLICALLIFRFKTYEFAILLGFYYTLFVADTYFWTNNELHQGVTWMFLCFGYIFSPTRPRSFATVVLVLIIVGALAIVTHPLVLVPFIFLWGFLLLSGKHWRFNKQQSVILTAIVLILAMGKAVLSKYYAGYDMAMINEMNELSLRSIVNTFTSELGKQLLKSTVYNFWLVPIIIFAGIGRLIWEQKYLLAAYTLVFGLGFFIALALTFHGYLAFYTESEFMPGAILAGAPFVYFLLPRLNKWTVVVVLTFIFIVRIQYIRQSSYHFRNRVQAIDNILQRMKHEGIERLALIKDSNRVEWTWMLDWGIPVESIMLSAINKDTVTRQFIMVNPGDGARIAVRLDQFVTTEVWNYKDINTFYFNFGAPQLYVVKPYSDYVR